MLGLGEYTNAFKKGYYDGLWEENIEELEIDLTDIASIGYSDGLNYGEYCKLTHQTMSISNEQLMAVIDKQHTIALKRMEKFRQQDESLHHTK